MKITKRLLTICMAAMLVCSMLLLTACGASDVEKAIADLRDAKSATMVDGDETTMYDTENLIAYRKHAPESGDVSEDYLWYDAENDKCYKATKEGNVIEKEELDKIYFFMLFSTYSDFSTDLCGFLNTIEFYTEQDGKCSLTETEDDETYTVSLYINDDGNLEYTTTYTREGTTKIDTVTYSAINDTEIVIPEDIKTAEAAANE